MALLQEIQVPLLAVNDTSLTVVEISRPAGSRVMKGEQLMVFETSKTTYDVEAGEEGYIQYLCEVDRDYEVNTVVARIYSEAAEAAVVVKAGKPAGPVASAGPVAGGSVGAVKVQPVASVGENARAAEGSIVWNWQGETIFSQEALRLIGGAGMDLNRFAGRDMVTAGDVRALLQPVTEMPPGGGETVAGSAVVGGGRDAAVATGTGKAGANPAPRKSVPVDPAKVIVQKLSSGKKREIEYLGEVQSTGLTSTLHIFIETEGIFTHINRSLKYLKDSLLPVIIYEVSRLLVDHPLLNAYFTGDGIARYKEVNPGFAIDIEKGLKVLKVAGAGQKSMTAIEQEILQLSGAYLDETLQVGDLTDITFTITDLSSEGVVFFKPLINMMNSAILGVSAIDKKLGRCALSLTFDHRVTEGKSAAQFLAALKERLESYRAVDTAAVLSGLTCFKCYKTLAEDLGGTGFARCITPEGEDGYICQSCLKGF